MPDKPIAMNSKLMVQGRIFWNDGRRRIDIKKPIRDLFEPLANSMDKVNYVMELYLDEGMLIQRTGELFSKGLVPLLIYFTKETVQNV